jgi:hypothetical protein
MQHQPIHKSQIINHKSLQAYRFCRAGINADTAIDAVVRVDFRLAINHADGGARALAYTGLTTRAFLPIDFGRHSETLS